MFQDITLEDLLIQQQKEAHTLIDVRSPKEFQESTIPGSINIPVFNTAERAEVGTIYKQVGKEAAKKRGLEIFSAKLPNFIDTFRDIDTPKTVFCWRGGMRSKTAATVLDLIGIKANRLEGGIRTYREWVVSTLNEMDFKPDVYVLNGYTGSGKTLILSELAEHGYPVLDLEGMAQHRGSIFGQIGLEPNNQKEFESQLVHKLLDFQHEPFVFMEGESKRIGKATMPEFLYDKKTAGKQLLIDIPMTERIQNILDDYRPWDQPNDFLEAFRIIKKRIHTPIAKQIEEDLQEGHYQQAVELLLDYYYDGKYEYSIEQFSEGQKLPIQAENVEEAVQKIEQAIPHPSTTHP